MARLRPSTPKQHTTRVLRVRLKDKHAGALRSMAGDVNFVWNYSNELSTKVFERERRFIGTFELHKHLRAAQAPRRREPGGPEGWLGRLSGSG
jgi:hypothetical protein